MIRSAQHAHEVQVRRRLQGKKGRAKAVRRWFKRTYGRAIEAHSLMSLPDIDHLRLVMHGDFTGCRGFSEVHGHG